MKNKFKLLFLITLIAPLAISCSSGDASNNSSSTESNSHIPQEEDYEKKAISFNVESNYDHSVDYEVSCTYSDYYFTKDATELNKNLLLASFANTSSCAARKTSKEFFEEAGFDHYYSYSKKDDDNTCVLYAFTHKTIDDFDLISISIFETGGYTDKWILNFDLGSEGNAQGFEVDAIEIMDNFKEYLKENRAKSTLKLWITGYSRGAGLANLLTNKLFDEVDLSLKEENVFTYTFESPRAVLESNVKGLRNVFNILNSYDLITYVAPEQLGFKREGIDIDVFDEVNFLAAAEKYPYLPITSFKESTKWPTPKDFIERFVGKLYSNTTGEVNIQTREEYCETFFPYLSKLLNTLFKFSFSRLGTIFSEISEKISLLSIIDDEAREENATAIHEVFEKYQFGLTIGEVKELYNFVSNLAKENYQAIAVDYGAAPNNFVSMIISHFDEYSYLCYQNYCNR